jgi:hypothetical protein
MTHLNSTFTGEQRQERPPLTATTLRAHENWKRLVMKVIQQSVSWDSVAYAIHVAARPPMPPPDSPALSSPLTPSHLTLAKHKSLYLKDLLGQNRLFLSHVDQNRNRSQQMEGGVEDERGQRWTERKTLISSDEPRPYVAPTLLELHEQYDVMGGISMELSSAHFSRQPSAQSLDEVPMHPLLKPLNKLINILNEFISTETSFVNDMNRLLLLLAELRYSTLLRVREFSSSAAFTGIYFASETINITNTQFLHAMISASEIATFPSEGELPPPPPPLSPHSSVTSRPIAFQDPLKCCEYALRFCDGVFEALQRFAPFFRLFSQFIVTHDSLSLLYSTLSFEDAEFTSILSQYETLLGESLLSLIIKPVQRLPRYVLLCKEIHHTLSKAYCVSQDLRHSPSSPSSSSSAAQPFELRAEDAALITTLEQKARHVHTLIADCAKQCNNSVRTHQDNLRMHQLYDMFREGGTNIPIVKNDRVIVKEGELKRHHRHSGMKSHQIQLFSDMLLSSSLSGKGLKLEQIFSLAKGTDTLCLPIPVRGSSDPDSMWFVLVSDDKTLFFGARTHLEMLRWVEAIHECLVSNLADSDVYLMKNQIALVNTLIGEIHRRSETYLEKHPPLDLSPVRQRSSSYERSYTESSNSIQASWWHLLDLLDEICKTKETEAEAEATEGQDQGSPPEKGNDPNPASHLRRVIEHHAKEAVSRMMLSISCPEDEKKGPNIIQTLLFNDTLRYIIAVGVFFEYTSTGATGSSGDFERPQLMKIFLLSDVLIGTYLNTVKDDLVYSFHIKLSDLQCSDYREGVSDFAILLSDTSKIQKRRLSIISRSTQAEYSKRILFASTIDMKFDWLSLMMQAVEGHRYTEAMKSGMKKGTPPIETLKNLSLQRIASDQMRCCWIAEVKPSSANMI